MSNSWCYDFIFYSLQYWPEHPAVLEVGSRNVNGSPRDVLAKTGYPVSAYVGVDMQLGNGVDVVGDAAHLDPLNLDPPIYDIIISTEMLEHVADWRRVLSQMEHRLYPEGLMIITTRSPGFQYHPWPEDHWRFTKENMQSIFEKGWKILHMDTDPDPGQHGTAPYYGVGVVAQRRSFPSKFSDMRLEVFSRTWEDWLNTIQVHDAP